MKTKAQLESDIAKMESALENPHISEIGRQSIKTAVAKAKELLKSAGEKSSKPGKNDKKKSDKALADCREILARAQNEMKTREKREKKREKAGLPPELTVGESVKKAESTVKNKVEKIEEKDEKPSAKDKTMTRQGVLGIIKAFVSTLSQQQARSFLNELVKQLKGVLKEDVSVKAENGMLIVDSSGKLSAAKNNTSFNVMKNGIKVGEIKMYTGGRSKEALTESAKKDFKNYWLKYYGGKDKTGYQLIYNGETFAEGGSVDSEPINMSDSDGDSGENVDVFGYQTQHFSSQPKASQLFSSISHRLADSPLAKFRNEGIRESASMLDDLFALEDRVVNQGILSESDCERAFDLAVEAQAVLTDSGVPEILDLAYPAVKHIFQAHFLAEHELAAPEIEESEPEPDNESQLDSERYSQFQIEVQNELAETMNITPSDAQGIMEAHPFELSTGWSSGMTPKETAEKIENAGNRLPNPDKAAKGKHIGFDALARKVERAYKKKGYSAKRAKEIGQDTAGKVYREQLAKKKAKGGSVSDDVIEVRSTKANNIAQEVFDSNPDKYGGEDGYYDDESPIAAQESPEFFSAVKSVFKKAGLKRGTDYLYHAEPKDLN